MSGNWKTRLRRIADKRDEAASEHDAHHVNLMQKLCNVMVSLRPDMKLVQPGDTDPDTYARIRETIDTLPIRNPREQILSARRCARRVDSLVNTRAGRSRHWAGIVIKGNRSELPPSARVNMNMIAVIARFVFQSSFSIQNQWSRYRMATYADIGRSLPLRIRSLSPWL